MTGSPPAAPANSRPGSTHPRRQTRPSRSARPGRGSRSAGRDRIAAGSAAIARGSRRTRARTRNSSGPSARGPVAAHCAQPHVEQLGRHRGACAMAAWHATRRHDGRHAVRMAARWALDFALPPRCAGCGTIVGDVHSFCPDCWRQIEFLGDSRLLDLRPSAAGDRADRSAAPALRGRRGSRGRARRWLMTICRAASPSASNMGARSRSRGRWRATWRRWSATARTAVLVPVPLHRTRLWWRGFNQSALVARELSRRLDIRGRSVRCSAGSGARRRSRE